MSLKFKFCQLNVSILLNISRTINHRNKLVMGKWYSEVGRHWHGVTGKLYYTGSCYIEGWNILSYTVFLYLHCLSFQQNKSFQRLVFGICETDGRLEMLSSTIFKDYWNCTPMGNGRLSTDWQIADAMVPTPKVDRHMPISLDNPSRWRKGDWKWTSSLDLENDDKDQIKVWRHLWGE